MIIDDNCDLLWQNREQVRATSFSLSRNQQCRLLLSNTIRAFLSRICGTPISIAKAYRGWTVMSCSWTHSKNTQCALLLMVHLIVNFLSNSMHRVGPILVMQYGKERENTCLAICALSQSRSQLRSLLILTFDFGHEHYRSSNTFVSFDYNNVFSQSKTLDFKHRAGQRSWFSVK